jgi:hypothetical protein
MSHCSDACMETLTVSWHELVGARDDEIVQRLLRTASIPSPYLHCITSCLHYLSTLSLYFFRATLPTISHTPVDISLSDTCSSRISLPPHSAYNEQNRAKDNLVYVKNYSISPSSPTTQPLCITLPSTNSPPHCTPTLKPSSPSQSPAH